MTNRIILALVFVVLTSKIQAQDNIKKNKKTLTTQRVAIAPTIDGNLDDIAWKDAQIATDFVMLRPKMGEKIPQELRTDVKVVYDDKAIYIAAYLFDDKPSEIPMEFTTRDNFGQTDYFVASISPLNDGINASEFAVMATGTQADANVSSSGNDGSWNAVWQSKVKHTSQGWQVEIRIPYAALRFSNEKKQIWGINFMRFFSKTKDKYSWSLIDRKKGSFTQYNGLLEGIENITPPVRLSFYPYTSATLSNFDGETTKNASIGMDLKYGINESFTLDATLIPDFGQTAFDDVTLNLGPFEQRYAEKRAFFTEGVDLFSKGNLFYSRRVGNTPTGKYDVQTGVNEELVENPDNVKLFNALKVSGRNKKGLGLGVFNAITQRTYATLRNLTNNEIRKVETEPLTNYSVFVLDKQFNKNSSVTLVNTNVLREGHFRDANVTGVLFDLNNKANKYGMSGGLTMSNVNEAGILKKGFQGRFDVGKISGNHQFNIGMDFREKDFDKNDLGFQRTSNELNYDANYSYRIFQPKGVFNNYGLFLWTDLNYILTLDKSQASYIAKGNNFSGVSVGGNFWATTKTQFTFGGNIHSNIGQKYDYYEARVDGRYTKENPITGVNAWFSTDYRKKLALDGSFYLSKKNNEYSTYNSFNISPLLRLSNKASLRYKYRQSFGTNLLGFVDLSGSDIIMGKHNDNTISNTLSGKYNFTVKSALTLSFRHYWSRVTYNPNYYHLQDDGSIQLNNYTANNDINYNAWNVDLNYSWEFAPGSQLVLFYTNSINNYNQQARINFNDNLNDLFKQPIRNSLSLKVIYYIDYNTLRKKHHS